MVLYCIALVVFGIVMGIAPDIVADNVKKCSKETDYYAKEKAKNRVNTWLYLFGLVIYLSLVLVLGRVCYDFDGQIKELKTRIEVLEEHMPQTDTTTVNIQNL